MSFTESIVARLKALKTKLDAGRPEEPISNETGESDSRVIFPLPDGPYGNERMWATSLGNNLYRIDNHPFYVYDVSWQDVVEAIEPSEDKHPVFQKVVTKSGNRTIRIICDKDHEALKTLNKKKCFYEGASDTFFSVNIPSSVDIKKVVSHLESSEVQWEYGDPSYKTLHPGSE